MSGGPGALAALEDARHEGRDPNLGEQLLLDVQDVIRAHGHEVGDTLALSTRDIIDHLIPLEERTWAVFGKARDAIRDFEVRDLLHPFGLHPKQVQYGGRGGPNRRGYRLAEVEAAVARYISPLPECEKGAGPLDGSTNPTTTRPSGLAGGSPQETGGARRESQEALGEDGRSSGLAPFSTPSDAQYNNGGGDGTLLNPAIGDRVQWTSEGVDQLPGGGTVTWVSDDGAFVRVDDSLTGIPVSQVTILTREGKPGYIFT